MYHVLLDIPVCINVWIIEWESVILKHVQDLDVAEVVLNCIMVVGIGNVIWIWNRRWNLRSIGWIFPFLMMILEISSLVKTNNLKVNRFISDVEKPVLE